MKNGRRIAPREMEQSLYNRRQVRVSGTVPFRMASSTSIPIGPGVYLLNDLHDVFYVGRTANLREAFCGHCCADPNPLLVAAFHNHIGRLEFSWCVSELPEQVTVEMILLQDFQPICNQQSRS